MKKIIQILLCGGLILMAFPVLAQSRPAAADTSRVLQRQKEQVARQLTSLKKQAAQVRDSLGRASEKDALQARLDRLRVLIDSTTKVQTQVEEQLKTKRDL
jgi:hypothetical protein